MDNSNTKADSLRASVVPASEGYRSRQGSHYYPGVSRESVGAKSLWLGIVTLPPGQRTSAHVHALHESAFYMMSGSDVELWSGEDLRHRQACKPGDYLFIPANVLHVAVNRGSEPAVFIGCRNEPTAHESMIPHPDMDAKVP